MSLSFKDRYDYGISGRLGPPTPQAEIVMYGPMRERQMLEVAKSHVRAQEEAGEKILRSNLANAKIISKEIKDQTESLSNVIESVGDSIRDEISTSTDKISNTINQVGEFIVFELREIKWLIRQQNEVLEEILNILRNNRNNESQELVRQGVRHFDNEEYVEAEERFLKALEKDDTDYQVLMNLGYIEKNKSIEANALKYFSKALRLPENLDSKCKSETLLAIARCYYAGKQFEKAFEFAELALKQSDVDNANDKYTLGVYAALSGKESIAIENIIKSISIKSEFFTKAIIDPDLDKIRKPLMKRLDQLTDEALAKAKESVDYIKQEINNLERKKETKKYINIFEKIKNQLQRYHNLLQEPSYSGCVNYKNKMSVLKNVCTKFNKLLIFCRDHGNLNQDLKKLNANGHVNSKKKPKVTILLGSVIIWTCASLSMIYRNYKIVDEGMSFIVGFFWPLLEIGAMLDIIGSSIGVPVAEKDMELFGGSGIGLIVGFVLVLLLVVYKNTKYKRNVSISNRISTLNGRIYDIESKMRDIETNIDLQLSKN